MNRPHSEAWRRCEIALARLVWASQRRALAEHDGVPAPELDARAEGLRQAELAFQTAWDHLGNVLRLVESKPAAATEIELPPPGGPDVWPEL